MFSSLVQCPLWTAKKCKVNEWDGKLFTSHIQRCPWLKKRNTKAYTHVVLPPRSTCMEMSKFRKTGLARLYPPTPSWPLWWQRQISAQTYRPIPQVITTGTWHKERKKQDRKKKKNNNLATQGRKIILLTINSLFHTLTFQLDQFQINKSFLAPNLHIANILLSYPRGKGEIRYENLQTQGISLPLARFVILKAPIIVTT